MTMDELAERLVRLDPGKHLAVEATELAHLFASDQLTAEVAREIEAYAIDHRRYSPAMNTGGLYRASRKKISSDVSLLRI